MKLFTIEKNKLSAAWLGMMETSSILIREKRKHFPRRQTGCLKCFGARYFNEEVNRTELSPSLRFSVPREYKNGKYHCTIDLLFGSFGLICANKNKNCPLSYS